MSVDPWSDRIRAVALAAVASLGIVSILATTGGTPSPTGAVACAGRDQAVTTGSLVQLDARCSGLSRDAAEDDFLVFNWVFTAVPPGTAIPQLEGRDSVNPSFVASHDGEYVLRLDARAESRFRASSDTLVVTASSANAAPTAHAGPGRQIKVGDSIVLDGSLSHDADGDLISYAWVLESPTQVGATLTGADTPVPVLAVPVASSYVLALRVGDGVLESRPDRVMITATADFTNACPDADAGADQRVHTGTLVTLDGAASSDADGDPISLRWRMIWRPAGSSAELVEPLDNPTPRFTPDVEGAYVFLLQADDAHTNAVGRANCLDQRYDVSDTTVVFASHANAGPIAAAGGDRVVQTDDIVELNGVGSSDADADPLTYQWRFVAMPPGSTAFLSSAVTAVTSFRADEAGAYVVELTVSDGFASDSDALVVVAETGVVTGTRPLADAGDDQVVDVGASVLLDGGASSDPNGDPLTYDWSWLDWPGAPDGPTPLLNDPTAVNPRFVADTAGTYVLRLVVSDGAESSLPDTVSVIARLAGGCSDPLRLVTALPYQPGTGESASVFRIEGDELSVVGSAERLDSDVMEARIVSAVTPELAEFVVFGSAWEETSRSHANPIADSESPSFVVRRLADNIYFKLDVGFTGDANLLEVRIDTLDGCRCGTDALDCPP